MTRSRLVALSLTTALVGASPAFAEVVRIGLLAPLTGPAAADGEEFVRGVEWAIEEANANGGVAGYTFELEVADVQDQSAANVSSAAQRLIGTEGVEMILTGYASLSMFEVDLMAEAGMPYLSAGPSPSFAVITTQAIEDYWCCWSYTASFAGYETDVRPAIEALAESGAFDLRDRTVAMISSDNAYSRTISEGMTTAFEEGGWDIVVDELVPFGEVGDWRAILARVRETNPDLVVNTDYLPGNSALFGLESGVYGVGLYEMANMYFEALEVVGDPTDREAIAAAIGAIERPTAAGNLAFDPETHVALQSNDHIPVSFWQLQEGGARVLIEPAQYANGTFLLPP